MYVHIYVCELPIYVSALFPGALCTLPPPIVNGTTAFPSFRNKGIKTGSQ